jgi:hypothetical protein
MPGGYFNENPVYVLSDKENTKTKETQSFVETNI